MTGPLNDEHDKNAQHTQLLMSHNSALLRIVILRSLFPTTRMRYHPKAKEKLIECSLKPRCSRDRSQKEGTRHDIVVANWMRMEINDGG